jgi:ABC-type methionine transport system ATPase subunit
MAVLLSLTQVTRRYPEGRRKVAVLDRVSLEIDAGDHLGIYDSRGTGKSTLLRVLAGIELPDEGTVCWDGQTVTQMSRRGRSRLLGVKGIALVSSGSPVQLNRPVVDYVALPVLGDGVPLRRARPLARRALKLVGAGECSDTQTDQLSLAERMRVALAAALIREPRLLLVDEPAVLPSPQESENLYELLRSLGRSEDLAVVIASQHLAALQGAPRIASLSAGGLRMMSPEAVVVPFPERQAARGGESPG